MAEGRETFTCTVCTVSDHTCRREPAHNSIHLQIKLSRFVFHRSLQTYDFAIICDSFSRKVDCVI